MFVVSPIHSVVAIAILIVERDHKLQVVVLRSLRANDYPIVLSESLSPFAIDEHERAKIRARARARSS